jgi:hypothetical protein
VGKYVGGHLSAPGVLITTGCSCLFVALSVGVLNGGPLVRFDRSTRHALHASASETPGLTLAFRILGALGSLEGLALVSLLVAAALLVWRTWSLRGAMRRRELAGRRGQTSPDRL